MAKSTFGLGVGGNDIRFTLEVKGVRKLAKKLDKLGKGIPKPMLNKAVTAAMRPIRDEVKREAHKAKDTGILARSITTKKYNIKFTKGIAAGGVGARYKKYMATRKPKTARARDMTTGMFASVKVKAKERQATKAKAYNPALYAHLVEFGTKFTRTKYPQGRFITPSIKKKKREAERIMIKVLRIEIKKRIAKIAAGGK